MPHSVPNHIALAIVAKLLSAFMPMPTVTSKMTKLEHPADAVEDSKNASAGCPTWGCPAERERGR